jgi:hypothetical protein
VALVLFMVAVEAVLTMADMGWIGDRSLRARVYAAGAFWAGLLDGGQPLFGLQPLTMFVSHALLHGGLLHLAMNMAVLLGLGRFASDRYGDGVILPVFLLSAIAGGLVFGLIADGKVSDGGRLGRGLRLHGPLDRLGLAAAPAARRLGAAGGDADRRARADQPADLGRARRHAGLGGASGRFPRRARHRLVSGARHRGPAAPGAGRGASAPARGRPGPSGTAGAIGRG